MRKILDELDPFFWMASVMIAGIVMVQTTEVVFTHPLADFAQAMTAPIEVTH